MKLRIHGFPPILGESPRVLILGSMPSVESLQKGEYYGNPRNHFWPLLYRILGGEGPPASYEERVAFLKDHKIAVWDVFSDCFREGSLDQNIDEASCRDVGAFLSEYPSILMVVLNGRRAEAGFWKALRQYGWISRQGNTHEPGISERFDIEAKVLPSTSPIPTRQAKCMEDKIASWKVVANYAETE